jgi:hypothetical protein
MICGKQMEGQVFVDGPQAAVGPSAAAGSIKVCRKSFIQERVEMAAIWYTYNARQSAICYESNKNGVEDIHVCIYYVHGIVP